MSLNHIVECISKPPAQRQDTEISELVDWFLKMCPLKIKPDVAKDILKNCEFRESNRDDVIIRQGDLGDCFYICLSGKVSVYINTEAVPDDPDDPDGDPPGEAHPKAAPVAAVPSTTTTNAALAAGGKKLELDRSKYGNFIVNFGAGKGFGELALINKDCVRNASIIADSTTLLIVVNRALYNRSLKVVQEAEYKERIDIVNSCNIFDNWASRYRRQAAMSLRKENFSFDAAIVRQGDQMNGLHFITSGQAKIVVNALQHYAQYPQLNWQQQQQQQDSIGGSRNRDLSPADDHRAKTVSTIAAAPPHRRQLSFSSLNQLGQSQRHLEVSLVGPGELIGDLEHGMGLTTYCQSLICTQPTEAFILDAKNYDRLVLNKKNASRSLEILAERARAKLSSRASRHLDRQVPLIRLLCRQVESQRLAEEFRRLQASKPAEELLEIRDSDVSHFIPNRGALIDPYGPGTVFWRNRIKRERTSQLQLAEKAKAKLIAAATAGQGEAESGWGGGGGGGLSEAVPEFPGQRSLTTLTSTTRALFRDCETSSERLSDLEKRIEGWFESVDATKAGAKPVAMTRFRNEEERKIYPGRRVCMRPRNSTARLQASIANMETQGGDAEDVFITAQAEIRSNSAGSEDHVRNRPQLDDEHVNISGASGLGHSKQHSPNRQESTRQSQHSLHHRDPGLRLSAAQGPAPGAGATASEAQAQSVRPESQLIRFQQQQQQQQKSSVNPLPPIDNQTSSQSSIINSASSNSSNSRLMWRSTAQSGKTFVDDQQPLTPAERRQNTAVVLKEILAKRTLPDDVRSTLLDLQRMSTVIPDLDSSCRQHQRRAGAGRTASQTNGLQTTSDKSGRPCHRCRRHHMAASLL